MARKSFTLLEIIVVLIIIMVVATLGLPMYENVVEDAEAKVCAANLQALNSALAIYMMEHDTAPGDLSKLLPYAEKAYAKRLHEKGAWKLRLAFFLISLEKENLAYAGLMHDISRGNIQLLTCPVDHTPPAYGGISYGFNSALKNIKASDFQRLPADTLIIGDCDSAEFADVSALSLRHRHWELLGRRNYAQAVRKDKQIHQRGRRNQDNDANVRGDQDRDNNRDGNQDEDNNDRGNRDGDNDNGGNRGDGNNASGVQNAIGNLSQTIQSTLNGSNNTPQEDKNFSEEINVLVPTDSNSKKSD